MKKVLFVCLGNICRSPLAEGVFKHLLEQQNLIEQIASDSAGTASYHIGELADPRTRKNAMSHGIHLTHCARAFSTNDFHDFDFIIAMDESNMRNIRLEIPSDSHAKLFLMRDFDPKEKGADVPDPYYGNAEDFEEVYRILSVCCERLLYFILNEI